MAGASDDCAASSLQLSEGCHQSSSDTMMACLCRKRTTNNSVLLPWRTRMILLIFALLQNGLAGGIIFGWASIDKTILLESSDCGGVGLNPRDTTLIFSRASSASMMSSLMLGMVLDNSGPRLCSIIACLIVFVGCQVFASSQGFTGISFGACLIAFGGPGIQPSIIHLANLFPENKYLVMSCLGGSVAISFSVFPVFDLLWNRFDGLSFRSLFLAYSTLVFLLGLGSFFLYPDKAYDEFKDDDDEAEQETELLCHQQPWNDSSDADPQTAPKMNFVSENHVISVTPAPSLQVDQPLNSYLRNDGKNYRQTQSFMASKKLLEKGLTSMSISLKDQPFYNQLFSTCYIRAVLVFLVTCFAANFYVVSLSTELADLNHFTPDVQHQLTQSFTLLIAMGAVASVLVGWLIDKVGLEISTALTLILGQLQMLMLVFFGDNYVVLMGSFCVYNLFRQFLYPVFIASLTARLGFKYFGLLLGFGYGIAGIAQLFLATLQEAVEGNCNVSENMDDDDECNSGHWKAVRIAQFLILGALLIVPIQQHRDKSIQDRKIRQILYTRCSSSNVGYGTEL